MTALPAPAKKKLGLVIDLDICVGCHACAVACKEWNDGGAFGPLPDDEPYGGEPSGVWFNRVHSYEISPLPAGEGGTCSVPNEGTHTRRTSSEGGGEQTQMVHFPRSCLHCETPDCVTVCPTGASYKRAEDGIVLVDEDKCIGCQLCAWACPYGAREIALPPAKARASDAGRRDSKRGTMQKCTLCVDRIYNETLDERDRQPACVMACPTRARMFGDLGDPDSAVSRAVAERDGYALMPEFGYRPVNRYLPPRPRRDGSAGRSAGEPAGETLDTERLPPLLRWLDKALSR
jgi:Fe-S-cluster-containing dehydrogenase component